MNLVPSFTGRLPNIRFDFSQRFQRRMSTEDLFGGERQPQTNPLGQYVTYTLFIFITSLASAVYSSGIFQYYSVWSVVSSFKQFNYSMPSVVAWWYGERQHPSSLGPHVSGARDDIPSVEWLVGSVVVEMLTQKLRLFATLNMAVCLLLLSFRVVVWLVFGKVKPLENKRVKERMLNYLLFKVVFIGTILEPEVADFVIWTSWFTILGFLKMLSFLARDRFDSMIVSSQCPQVFQLHIKILILLVGILLANTGWFWLCVFLFGEAGPSVLMLLVFECCTLFLDTVQTIGKYVIQIIDLYLDEKWESRSTWLFYMELTTESLTLLMTLFHYIHIWTLNGISFTLIDVILLLNMQAVSSSLVRRVSTYRNYVKLVREMEHCFEQASTEELKNLSVTDEVCAICLGDMTAALKLPCGHFFHKTCFRQWLEKIVTSEFTCPICRHDLNNTATDVSNQGTSGDGIHQSGDEDDSICDDESVASLAAEEPVSNEGDVPQSVSAVVTAAFCIAAPALAMARHRGVLGAAPSS